MESFLIHWGYAAVFLFGFLEACCVPIPSGITFGFAGALAGAGDLNIVGVIVVGTAAELIGYLADFPSEVSTRYAAIFLPMSSPTCREFRKWMPPQTRISMCSSASSAMLSY